VIFLWHIFYCALPKDSILSVMAFAICSKCSHSGVPS
jgi:hypothetical protein